MLMAASTAAHAGTLYWSTCGLEGHAAATVVLCTFGARGILIGGSGVVHRQVYYRGTEH